MKKHQRRSSGTRIAIDQSAPSRRWRRKRAAATKPDRTISSPAGRRTTAVTGYIIGSTAGIWAESPDRVYIFNRGCLPVLKREGGGGGGGGEFIPERNASGYDMSQKDPARHPRWDHVFNVVDRNGKLIESWEQHNKLFVRPHRILVNPYDPERHVWLVDDGAHAIYKFTTRRQEAGADDRHADAVGQRRRPTSPGPPTSRGCPTARSSSATATSTPAWSSSTRPASSS